MTITVRITPNMLDRMADYVDPSTLPVFHHDVVQSTKHLIDVTAPFIAWQVLVDEIGTRMAMRGGRVMTDHTTFLRGILRRAATPMNAVLMHPALVGRAKAGAHDGDGAFPVWSMPTPDRWGRVWWPMPNGGEFELLKPRLRMDHGLRYTCWDHLGLTPRHWAHDPTLHIAIAERTALPALSAEGRRPSRATA